MGQRFALVGHGLPAKRAVCGRMPGFAGQWMDLLALRLAAPFSGGWLNKNPPVRIGKTHPDPLRLQQIAHRRRQPALGGKAQFAPRHQAGVIGQPALGDEQGRGHDGHDGCAISPANRPGK